MDLSDKRAKTREEVLNAVEDNLENNWQFVPMAKTYFRQVLPNPSAKILNCNFITLEVQY